MKQMPLKERLSRPISMLTCMVLALSLALTLCTARSYGYERINTKAEASLTATFVKAEDVSFRLYKVADVSDAVVFTLAGDFADAAVSLDEVESASDWADMAATLDAYAAANKISAGYTGTTDADGNVSFSGLEVGLYLLVGDAVVIGDYSYTPAPAVVMLPTLLEDDTWEYAPAVEVKYEKTFVTEYRDITVKKSWDDGGYSGRPDSVKIQLLRDGKVFETVTLSASNNWSYTWSDLANTYEGANGTMTHAWTVNEASVPSGYTMLVSQNGDTFTVTNTHKEETSPKPSEEAPSGGSSTGSTSTDPKLPQTGTLSWPIPVLAVSGLLLVGLGWYLLTRKKEN